MRPGLDYVCFELNPIAGEPENTLAHRLSALAI